MFGKSLGKRYDAWYILFGICPCMSLTPKFWQTYVIMYSDFMAIVEPSIWGSQFKWALTAGAKTVSSLLRKSTQTIVYVV